MTEQLSTITLVFTFFLIHRHFHIKFDQEKTLKGHSSLQAVTTLHLRTESS